MNNCIKYKGVHTIIKKQGFSNSIKGGNRTTRDTVEYKDTGSGREKD